MQELILLFSAAVDANGDLALTAGANGAGVLNNTVVLAVYKWAADDAEVKADTTNNTTGSGISAITTSSTSSTLILNGSAVTIMLLTR